ncbi:hypothetical protein ABG768_013299, partial [Culter alburnus]
DELDDTAQVWNTHTIRLSKNISNPSGRPSVMDCLNSTSPETSSPQLTCCQQVYNNYRLSSSKRVIMMTMNYS